MLRPLFCGLAFVLAAMSCLPARAQSAPTFLVLGKATGALYRPDKGPAPVTALVVMHRTADFMKHRACKELSQRGFLVLCMNSRFVNNESGVIFEELPLDVKEGVLALRKQPGIKHVLLFAHSGGGPLMALYQAVAENGIGFCQGTNKLSQCDDSLAGLPKADGIVFADVHLGNAIVALRSLNPSLPYRPDGPIVPDPALDPWSSANGFAPTGPSNYSQAFRARFYAAQSARMNELIAYAQDRLAAAKAGKVSYPDNDILVIPGAGANGTGSRGVAHLWIAEPTVPEMMWSERPERLLRNDGSIVATDRVKSVFSPEPANAARNLTFDEGTKILTLKSFLSANAIRSNDAVQDIDFCSSNNSTICAIKKISVPVTMLGMGAHYFIHDMERLFDAATSKDKDLIYVEGATHSLTPCEKCSTDKQQYANATKNTFDYIAQWINKRFR